MTDDDQCLVVRAQAGDRLSMERLLRRTGRRLIPYLRRRTRDDHEAEEMCQDTLLTVLQSLGELRQPERYWPWVIRISGNKVRQQGRRRACRPMLQVPSMSDMEHLAMTSDRSSVLGRMCERESVDHLRDAITELEPHHRAVLTWRFFDARSHDTIGEMLGCSAQATRAILFRAKKALRQKLERRERTGARAVA